MAVKFLKRGERNEDVMLLKPEEAGRIVEEHIRVEREHTGHLRVRQRAAAAKRRELRFRRSAQRDRRLNLRSRGGFSLAGGPDGCFPGRLLTAGGFLLCDRGGGRCHFERLGGSLPAAAPLRLLFCGRGFRFRRSLQRQVIFTLIVGEHVARNFRGSRQRHSFPHICVSVSLTNITRRIDSCVNSRKKSHIRDPEPAL